MNLKAIVTADDMTELTCQWYDEDSEEHSDIMLKNLAEIIAGMNGKEVVFEIPDAVEAAGYSTATKARLDGHKLQKLGWRPRYDIINGMERTLSILKEI